VNAAVIQVRVFIKSHSKPSPSMPLPTLRIKLETLARPSCHYYESGPGYVLDVGSWFVN
jgi:hypothetical protein